MKSATVLLALLITIANTHAFGKKVRMLEGLEEIGGEENHHTESNSTAPNSTIKHFPCQNTLLYSYGILNSGPTNEESTLCGDSKVDTCCSKISEEIIMNFWNNNNKVKIKQYIEGYVWLFKAILNHYQLYSMKAKRIIEYPGSNHVCRESAQFLIDSYIAKDDIEMYTNKLLKVFENVAFTRKGFYCMLCNNENQEFFDIEKKTVTFAKKFCQTIVESSLNEIYIRNKVYMPIFNAMSVIAECDPNSEYVPETYTIDMKLETNDENKVAKCYESYYELRQTDPRVYFDDCSDFCGAYSLTKATEIFEGNFGKLYFLFRKLRQFNEVISFKQLIFEQVNVEDDYNFSMISPEFFDANLKNTKFEKFSISWGEAGINLFYTASKSKNYYTTSGQKIANFGSLFFFIVLLKFI